MSTWTTVDSLIEDASTLDAGERAALLAAVKAEREATLAMAAQLAGQPVTPSQQGAAILFLATQMQEIAKQRDAMATALGRCAIGWVVFWRVSKLMNVGTVACSELTGIVQALVEQGKAPSEEVATLLGGDALPR
jgi:hypothetical protein